MAEQKNVEIIETGKAEVKKLKNFLDTDYDFARKNIVDLIKHSKKVLNNLIFLATTSEDTRVYDVLNEMIKTFTEVNKELLNIRILKSDIEFNEKNIQNQNSNPYNINNALFIGSTNELLQAIEDRNKNKNNEKSLIIEEEEKH